MSTAIILPDVFLNEIGNSEILTTTASEETQLIDSETRQFMRKAIDELKIIRAQKTTVYGVSGGKDSLIITIAGLKAHLELIAEGSINFDAPFIVFNIDTKVESVVSQLLIKDYIQELSDFSKKHKINLRVIKASPVLTKEWASLYISGIKVYSTPRMPNDCTNILKLDTASQEYKKLDKEFGGVVRVIGVRQSESTKRSASIRKTKLDQLKAEDLISQVDSKLLFAPITEMEDKHVWHYIAHAGVKAPKTHNGDSFFSFSPSHDLIKIIYEEATSEGTCPISDIGKGTQSGSCSSSGRMGCFVCLKSRHDNSAKELNRKHTWHKLIAGNIEKVRNWIMHEAQNTSSRNWHTRAIDETTGGVALAPNVMSAQHYDLALRYLTQVTFEEQLRAKKLNHLIANNQLHLDDGYQSLVANETFTKSEKDTLINAYIKYATTPLVAPISRDISLFISLIHSRDGVALPPFRAFSIWHEINSIWKEASLNASDDMYEKEYSATHICRTEIEWAEELLEQRKSSGQWLKYPDVDLLDKSIVTPIEDVRIILPEVFEKMAMKLAHSEELALYGESSCCEKKEPVRIGSKTVNGYTSNDFLQMVTIGSLIKTKLKRKPRKHKFSKRLNANKKYKNGYISSLRKGRSSVDKPSCSLRSNLPAMCNDISKPIRIPIPNFSYQNDFLPQNMLNIEDEAGSYILLKHEVNGETEYNPTFYSTQYDDGEDAYLKALYLEDYSMSGLDTKKYEHILSNTTEREFLEQHDIVVDRAKRYGKSIYQYQGTKAFKDLIKYDYFSLSPQAKRNAEKMIVRTNYFRRLGIYDLSHDELIKLSISMPIHRKIKAQKLLDIRKKRNLIRSELKSELALYNVDLIQYHLKLMKSIGEEIYRQVSVLPENQNSSVFSSVMKEFFEKTEIDFSNLQNYFRMIGEKQADRLIKDIKGKQLLIAELNDIRKSLGFKPIKDSTSEIVISIKDNILNTMSSSSLF